MTVYVPSASVAGSAIKPPVNVVSTSPTMQPLSAKAAPGQSAYVFETFDSNNAPRVAIDAVGNTYVGSLTTQVGGISSQGQITGPSILSNGFLAAMGGQFFIQSMTGQPPSGNPSLWFCSGVPSNATGANGDFCLRQDGAAGACLYQRRAGAWVATAA